MSAERPPRNMRDREFRDERGAAQMWTPCCHKAVGQQGERRERSQSLDGVRRDG